MEAPMKSEDLIKRAFNNLQNATKTGRPSAACAHNLITLAWVLDILPPNIDEVTTQRLVGDPDKQLAHLISFDQLIHHLKTAKV
jgi:hypothetical protein